MPDWTYHPVYRPIMFRLPAEDARRFTMLLLAIQSKTKIGRELFRLLSYGRANGHAHAFGLTFPGRFGLGPDVDTDARALGVLQYLGCAFLTVGPVCVAGRPRVRSCDRQRVTERYALTRSVRCYAPAAAVVKANLGRRDIVEVPVGVVVDDPDPAAVIAALNDRVDFFSLRDASISNLASARAATARPILLRVPLDGGPAHALAEARRANDAGLNGVVIGDGEDYVGARESYIDSAASLTQVLECVVAVRSASETPFGVVASCGVITPEDAVACVRAGADLVEVASGFVYSGPGLIARALALPQPATRADATRVDPATDARGGGDLPTARARMPAWILMIWAAVAAMMALGILVVPVDVLAGLSTHSPWLVSHPAIDRPLMTSLVFGSLCAHAVVAIPLVRRGERWPSWLVALSAASVAVISPGIAAVGVALIAAWDLRSRWLRDGFRPMFEAAVPAWRWSAANLGKRMMELATVVSALIALTSAAPAPVRLAAAGTAGCTLLLLVRGLRPGVRALWFGIGGCVGAAIAIAATVPHQGWRTPLIVLAACAFVAGLRWLWGPLVRIDEGLAHFPDV